MGTQETKDTTRQAVREQYGQLAREGDGCCGPGCCGAAATDIGELSAQLGYSVAELQAVPDGANMGLGCGNPQAIGALQAGETVLDLGSGGGFDSFLAARAVGDTGRVIGVDMTPDMLSKARANAPQGGYTNVEFRLGEIEHLPVGDATVDVILSNCVINLSPDKPQVFAEMRRVLRPGGRIAISDVVARSELPQAIREDMRLYTSCIAGASLVSDIEAMLEAQAFTQIRIQPREESATFIEQWAPGMEVGDWVVSATIEAVKKA